MSVSLTITFIRHGESTDNLRSVWAGWADAPLSNHGMNQARALGEFFADTHFTAIHASDLKRAYTTAQAVYDRQEPKPPFTSSQLLREQHFGVAEEKPWMIARDPAVSLEDHFAQGKYPVLFNDDERFPEGESMEDLAARARQAIEEIVLPYVRTAAREGKKGLHVAVVSHGLCISQLVAQLLKKSADPVPKGNLYKGLNNTAWARATVDVKGATEGEPMEVADNDLPPLVVRVTDFNRHSHTDNVKRQKGLGSAAYDPNQKDIRAFFGGQTVTPTEEPHSESNAHDGVVEDAIPKARA